MTFQILPTESHADGSFGDAIAISTSLIDLKPELAPYLPRVLPACVSMAVGRKRSEPHFSRSLRSFLLDPMGSMQTLMGMQSNQRASVAVFLLRSSQKILLPNYLGALVNLFPATYM